MNQEQKVIRVKVGVLELAKQLGNVSAACRVMGYSRDSFYRFKELYDQGGEAALQEISRHKPVLRNRVAPEVEQAVVEIAIGEPAWGQLRVANELKKRGLSVSAAGALRLAASQSRDHAEAAQSIGGKERAGRFGAEREPAQRAGKSQGRQGSAWRVRERMAGLLRRAGYVLSRHAQGRRSHLSADFPRYLHETGVRQAL